MNNGLQKPNSEIFGLFQRLIQEKTGIFLPEHKNTLLLNRLAKRLFAREIGSFDDYYRLITSINEHAELDLALELITTNETYFFREPKHFEFLRNVVLDAPNDHSQFRVWSAASSTGEEAYSVAMTLMDCCVRPWEVFASDINQSVIEQARKGIYLDQRTTGISSEHLQQYCRKGFGAYEGHLRVVPELRNRVDFHLLNLMEPLPQNGTFDVIFLRNVMIYFEKVTQQKLLKKLSHRLKPGGWLLVGHSESLHSITDDYYQLRPSIYRLSAHREAH